jgi:hypothetical protein
VSVALPIVLGWIVDVKPVRSEFDDRVVEALDSEPDRTVGVTHAARIGDSEMRSIRKCEHVGLDTADVHPPEAEGVLHKTGHLDPLGRRGSCKDQSEYVHERSLWRRPKSSSTTHKISSCLTGSVFTDSCKQISAGPFPNSPQASDVLLSPS